MYSTCLDVMDVVIAVLGLLHCPMLEDWQQHMQSLDTQQSKRGLVISS
jgi:hypothetical protein